MDTFFLKKVSQLDTHSEKVSKNVFMTHKVFGVKHSCFFGKKRHHKNVIQNVLIFYLPECIPGEDCTPHTHFQCRHSQPRLRFQFAKPPY